MKIVPPLMLAAALALTACAGSKQEPLSLPEGTPTKTIVVSSESLLRGVRGSSSTTPRGRPAAILSVRYTLACMNGGSPSADQRSRAAKQALDKTFAVSPYYFQNPRERGYWRREANSTAVKTAGCEVIGLEHSTKTNDPIQVLGFIVENGVQPVR